VNCDGISAEHSLKMEELVNNIQQHHIIFMTETRTTDVNGIIDFLPHHVIIGQTNIPDNCNGRKGFGVALLAATNIAEYIHLTNSSEQIQTIWATCNKRLFAKGSETTLCAVYIQPGRELESQLAHLGDEIQQALTDTPHLIVCGEFNAHIGNLR